MKIKTNLTASMFSSVRTFDLDDLDITEEDWNILSYNDKRTIIKTMIEELPEQPYWTLEKFEEL